MDYSLLGTYARRNGLELTLRPVEQWPGALTPTYDRRSSQFSAPWPATCGLLGYELRQVIARSVVLQVALAEHDLRRDGLPRAAAQLDHPGAVLSFESGAAGGAVQFATDSFIWLEDNIRAIALGLEALRKLDRFGITERGQQYTGWLAIEARPAQLTADGAARMLLDASGFGDSVRHFWGDEPTRVAVWREVVRRHHPDRGGDHDRWVMYVEARRLIVEAVLEARKAAP